MRVFKYVMLAFSGLFLLNCEQATQQSATPETPPNIVFIIADDMAWNDCSAYGHPSIKTPNLDKLAKEGMLFTQAFLTTSSCSPSRSSIITGTYPHQTDAEQLHWPLPADKITFVEKLKEAGYWTAQAGKWHLGDFVKDRFDYLAPAGTSGFVFKSDDNNKEEKSLKNDGSGCQAWVPTLQKRPKNKPFFLWLAAFDPHRPYDRAEKRHHIQDVEVPVYLPDNEQVRQDLALYYDEISRLDDYVGDVIAELDREGLSENTLVLFISDNGRPFPRDKTTLYDGGIKTPWIVKWPSKVQKGSKSEVLISSVDIAKTFLSLAGLSAGDNFVGKDFSEVLTNPTSSIRDYVYAEDHWHDHEDYGRAIRTNQYKYIRNFYPDLPNTPPADALRSPSFQSMLQLKGEGKLSPAQRAVFMAPRAEAELYDIKKDPNELNNLAKSVEYAAVLKQMQAYMTDIRTATQDKLPTKRTADEFDRELGKPLPNRIRPRPSKAEMAKKD